MSVFSDFNEVLFLELIN